MNKKIIFTLLLLAPAVHGTAQKSNRVVEITADRDSTYKVPGSSGALLTLTAGEAITLRITTHKAKSMNRDGSVHGLVLLARNGAKIPGWNLLLKPGIENYDLTAPSEAGEYKAVCTVICSQDHLQMQLKVKVIPAISSEAK